MEMLLKQMMDFNHLHCFCQGQLLFLLTVGMFTLWTITITTCRFVSKLELVLRDTWARFEKLNFSVLWWNISSQFLQTVLQYLKKNRYDYHSASSTVFSNRRISIFNCVGDIAGSVVSQSERVWVLANRRNSRYDISRKRKSAFRWWAPSFVPQWQFNSSTVSRSFLSLFTLTDFNFKLDLSQRIYCETCRNYYYETKKPRTPI